VRVKFAMVDTAGVDDGVRFVDSGSAELSGQRIGGVHKGPVWSDWIDVPEGDGRVVAALGAGAGGQATTGVSTEALQYRVRKSGAGQAWPRIRFPGHYADAETGLNENWHRYYEPGTGRYAQPEPVLSEPTTVADTTSSGLGWSAYGYATSNPVAFYDGTGLYPDGVPEKPDPLVQKARTKALIVGAAVAGACVAPQAIGLADEALGAWLLRRAIVRAAAGAAAAGGGAATARTGTTTLFRSVSEAEFTQVMKTGAFEAGPNSLGGKFFAGSAADAAKWGEALNGAGNFKILQVELPTSTLKQMMYWQRLDAIGPAWYGELPQLGGATITPDLP
jgi:RHS repeat-associated protein